MAVASVEQNDIEHAAGMDNVDRVAKYLQDIAGIATGDVPPTTSMRQSGRALGFIFKKTDDIKARC
jgi:hypothetical protein